MDEKDGNTKELQGTDFDCPFNGLEYDCENCFFEHPSLYRRCQEVNGFNSSENCVDYPDKCRTCNKYGICADIWGWD